MKSVKRGKKDPTIYDMEITRGRPDIDSDSDTHILSLSMRDQKDAGIGRLREVSVTYEDGQSAVSSKQHV